MPAGARTRVARALKGVAAQDSVFPNTLLWPGAGAGGAACRAARARPEGRAYGPAGVWRRRVRAGPPAPRGEAVSGITTARRHGARRVRGGGRRGGDARRARGEGGRGGGRERGEGPGAEAREEEAGREGRGGEGSPQRAGARGGPGARLRGTCRPGGLPTTPCRGPSRRAARSPVSQSTQSRLLLSGPGQAAAWLPVWWHARDCHCLGIKFLGGRVGATMQYLCPA